MKANSKLFKFQTLEEQVEAIAFMAANDYSPTWDSGVYKKSNQGRYWVRFYVQDGFNWDLLFTASTQNVSVVDEKISLIKPTKFLVAAMLLVLLVITIVKPYVSPDYQTSYVIDANGRFVSNQTIALQETPVDVVSK